MIFTAYSLSTRQVLYSGSADVPDAMQDANTGILVGAAHSDGWIDGSDTHHPIPARPSDFHSWDWGTKAWVADLAGAVAAKKSAVTDRANAASRAPIAHGSAMFSADETARIRILGMIGRFDRGGGMPAVWIGWLDATGAAHWESDNPATVRYQIEALSAAIENRDAAIVMLQKAYYDAIDQLQTVEAVVGYDITTGWPS